MFSTPPAMNNDPSPDADRLSRADHRLQARAAEPVHRLPRNFDRQPGEQRRHPRDVAIVSPAWLVQPKMTSSIRAGGTPERSTTALTAMAARSSARTSASAPPARPTGVRSAVVMKASVISNFQFSIFN
jgi:hypothetical protein